MEGQLRDAAVSDDKPPGFIRNPYPYFAQKRDGAGVFRGTVVDYSKTPESLRPKNSFAAVSFEAVNTAFRDAAHFQLDLLRQHDRLVHRPFHFGDGRQEASRTPQSGVRGVQVQGARALGTRGRAADLRRADRRIRRRRECGPGPRFHLRVPDASHRQAAGPARRGSADFPSPRSGVDQLHRQVRARIRGIRRAERLLPGTDRTAQGETDRRHHRRSRHRGDRRRKAQRRRHLLVPAVAASRRIGDHLPLVGQPVVPVAHSSRAVRGGPGRSRADRTGDRRRSTLRNAFDHRAAIHDRRHCAARGYDSRPISGRSVHRLGQSRPAPLATFGGIRHLSQAGAARLLRRRRAHLLGPAPGTHGDAGRVGMPAESSDRYRACHR